MSRWLILIVVLGASQALATLLDKKEWGCINPRYPLTHENNIQALVSCRMERYTPAKLLSRFDRVKHFIEKRAIADLKHQDTHITDHPHPYYYGAARDFPKEYYRTLLLQYSLDINTEKPFKLLFDAHHQAKESISSEIAQKAAHWALSKEHAAIFIKLLNIEVSIGLKVDSAELGKDERIVMSVPALKRLLEDSRFSMRDPALDMILMDLSYQHVHGKQGVYSGYTEKEGRELFKHMLDVHALQPNYEFANHERLINVLMVTYREFGVDILFKHPDFDLNYVRERYPELDTVGDDQQIRERQERLARLIEKEN